MFWRIIKKNRLLFIVIGLFLFLRLPSLFEPYWYGDEGIYLVLGQAIRKGLLLYRDIHDNKPPTLYYLAALGQTVFGFRLLLLLWMIPANYIFYLLSKKFLSLRAALISSFLFIILTSIPLFEGNISNAEIFMSLPTILGVYLFLFSSHQWKYIYSGLLLGFAFTIKVPVFIEFAFLCFYLLINNLSFKKISFILVSSFQFLISFLLPILVYLVYFWKNGAINQFLFAALFQNFGYLSSWSLGSHSGSATSGGVMTRGLILFLFWVGTAITFYRHHSLQKYSLLLWWFSATLFGALLSTRPYPHYLIQIIPPLSLLVGVLFDSKLNHKSFIRPATFGTFVVLILIFLKYKFYVYPVFSYYLNFYSYSLGFKTTSQYNNFYGSSISNIYQVSNYLRQHTTADQKIFVWGDEPYIYALSERLPVGRYAVAYHIADFNQYDEVYQQLIVNFPKYIIYIPQDNRPYPQLDKFISSYYFLEKTFDNVRVYKNLE